MLFSGAHATPSMEGFMLCCSRLKPPWIAMAAASPFARCKEWPIALVGGDACRRRRHSSTCLLARADVPSIWHAITPSSSSCAAPLRRRRWRGAGAEEGSWNAAWDVRPARWLHGPDSAWMLFGVCSCFSPPGLWDGDLEAVSAPEEAGRAAAGDAAAPEYKVTEDKTGSLIHKLPGMRPFSLFHAHFFQNKSSVQEDYLGILLGMLADGRCLFRAVAYGACLSNGGEAPEESEQTKLADDLRTRVADELLKRRDEMKRFIEEDFDAYVEHMRQPYVWGGEPELLMASHVLETPLSVFKMDQSTNGLVNIANYGMEYVEKKNESIKVLFHGYGHYDSLQLIEARRV